MSRNLRNMPSESQLAPSLIFICQRCLLQTLIFWAVWWRHMKAIKRDQLYAADLRNRLDPPVAKRSWGTTCSLSVALGTKQKHFWNEMVSSTPWRFLVIQSKVWVHKELKQFVSCTLMERRMWNRVLKLSPFPGQTGLGYTWNTLVRNLEYLSF